MVFLFLLIEFFDELHYGVQTAVLPVLRQDFGLTYAQVGLLLGFPTVIGAFVEPVIMLFGDTRLKKPLIVTGGFLIGISVLIIATTNLFPALLFAFVLAFPSSGAFVTLAQATLIDFNPGREPHMMARWTVAGSIGNLIGPMMVAGGFALSIGWRWNYILLAVFVIFLVISVTIIKNPVYRNRQTEGVQTLRGEFATLVPEVLRAIFNPGLMRWMILLQSADLLLDVFNGYVALYFLDVVGLNPVQIGVLLSVLMLTGLFSDVILIPLLERIPGRRVVRFSAAICVLVYIIWLLAPWIWLKILFVILIRLSTLGWYQVLQGEAYAALPGRSGTVMAINSVIGLLGGWMFYSIGWIATKAGLSVAMWILLLGPLSLAFFVPRPKSALASCSQNYPK